MSYLERIRIDPAVRSGKPTIHPWHADYGPRHPGVPGRLPGSLPRGQPCCTALRGRSGAPALFRSFVRLLFDENLSFRLVREPAEVYLDSAHVVDVLF